MEEILLYFTLKYDGDFTRVMKALSDREPCVYEEAKQLGKTYEGQYTTIISDNYPERLRRSEAPPIVLFYQGDLSLANSPHTIAVIGSRLCTNYGRIMTSKVVPELVEKKMVIVSGLAKGIDGIAHQVTLEQKGKTIAVLGNGFNHCYPEENKELQKQISEVGLLLSEYPLDVAPNKDNFPRRNRIIAGLADSILVVEAKKRSGTMITVNEALKNGKDILCFPTQATCDSGCNELIKCGAYLVENAREILDIVEI